MSFTEMVQTLVQRPGYLGVLGGHRVVMVNARGYLLDATKKERVPMRLHTSDLLALTWECWTPEQLQAMAEQAGVQQ